MEVLQMILQQFGIFMYVVVGIVLCLCMVQSLQNTLHLHGQNTSKHHLRHGLYKSIEGLQFELYPTNPIQNEKLLYKELDKWYIVDLAMNISPVSFILSKDGGNETFLIANQYTILKKLTKLSDNQTQFQIFYHTSCDRIREINIIVDDNTTDMESSLFWKYIQQHYFPWAIKNNSDCQIYEWPPVHTRRCPTSSWISKRNANKERGIALAHQGIWQDFLLRNKKLNHHNPKKDVILIFESDAHCRSKSCAEDIFEAIVHMESDILFLGWCDKMNQTLSLLPYCTHAYAVTERGAKILLEEVDPCRLAIDEQFQLLGIHNKISFQRAVPFANSFIKNKSGIPIFGLFAQLEHDKPHDKEFK